MNLEKILETIEQYDFDKLEKLQEEWNIQLSKIYKRLKEAKEQGDKKALANAKEALRKYLEKTDIIKEKARAIGFYWF